MVEAIPLLAYGFGKELFNYNRENYKFDQEQKLVRETWRLEMQVKRYELFREDVRDLVELTVDRMDVYHLVGALFLEFVIVLFTEGRVQGSAPPFLLASFLLSNACAFIYLLLAVWLSMHASIAAHSFGVRLLTRFVRLPIPSLKELNSLTYQLKDYEEQGVGNMLRLPFLAKKKQDWTAQSATGQGNKMESERKQPPFNTGHSYAAGTSDELKQRWYHRTGRSKDDFPGVVAPGGASFKTATFGAPSASSLPVADHARTTSGHVTFQSGSEHHRGPATAAEQVPENLLPEQAEAPLGGEDLLTSSSGALPERHVQLFRRLQTKWQCYDAYCRVCMGLGVNQILQGLSYYAVCHTLVENQTPTTGFLLIICFQCTTVAIAVLDLAGMKRKEIVCIQVIGMVPCCIAALEITFARRTTSGELFSTAVYSWPWVGFLFQAFWLELWLRISKPTGEGAQPRRFRQVLFLDVFGDATGWQPGLDDDDTGLGDLENEEECQKQRVEAASSCIDKLKMAQGALRRWKAVPTWCLSSSQARELDHLHRRLYTSGSQIQVELEAMGDWAAGELDLQVFEPHLKPLKELSVTETFQGTLLGPFKHGENVFHWDVDKDVCIWADAPVQAFVLEMTALQGLIQELEMEERRLLEVRIVQDIHRVDRALAPHCPSSLGRVQTRQAVLELQRATSQAVQSSRSMANISRLRNQVHPAGRRETEEQPQRPTLRRGSSLAQSFPNISTMLTESVQQRPPNEDRSRRASVKGRRRSNSRLEHSPDPGRSSVEDGIELGGLGRSLQAPSKSPPRSPLRPHALSSASMTSLTSVGSSSAASAPPPTEVISEAAAGAPSSDQTAPAIAAGAQHRSRLGASLPPTQQSQENPRLPREQGAQLSDAVTRISTRDVTLKAMAGKNAKYFVPERLPWQIVLSITRVHQLCWLACAGFELLRVWRIVEVDHQRLSESRKEAEDLDMKLLSQRLDLEVLDVEWPNHGLFNPQAISCARSFFQGDFAGGEGSTFIVSTPYSAHTLFWLNGQSFWEEQSDPDATASTQVWCIPSSPTSFNSSSPSSSTPQTACAFGEISDQSIYFWRQGLDRQSASSMRIDLSDGFSSPWPVWHAAPVLCSQVGHHLDSSVGTNGHGNDQASAKYCLLVAFWDETALNLASLRLDDETGLPTRDQRVIPSVDLPLEDFDWEGPLDEALQHRNQLPVHISFHAESGRIWVLFHDQTFSVWDIYSGSFLGNWRPKWEASEAGPTFGPKALCDAGSEGLFILGHSAMSGPTLLRASQMYGEGQSEMPIADAGPLLERAPIAMH